MSCCNLLVIEQIEQFDDHTRKDVDYRASGGFYDSRHCWASGWQWETDWTEHQAVLEQQAADEGSRGWAFSDPERVALEALKRKHGQDVAGLTLMKTTPAMRTYEWRHGRKWST